MRNIRPKIPTNGTCSEICQQVAQKRVPCLCLVRDLPHHARNRSILAECGRRLSCAGQSLAQLGHHWANLAKCGHIWTTCPMLARNWPELDKHRPRCARIRRMWLDWGSFRPKDRHGPCVAGMLVHVRVISGEGHICRACFADVATRTKSDVSSYLYVRCSTIVRAMPALRCGQKTTNYAQAFTKLLAVQVASADGLVPLPDSILGHFGF